MQEVEVTIDFLKSHVQRNMATHKKDYKEAFKGYKKECIEILKENLEAMESGDSRRLYLNETPPEDHTKDYERVLKMANASVSKTVVLTQEEFSAYIDDDWGWKQNWMVANTKYMTTRSG